MAFKEAPLLVFGYATPASSWTVPRQVWYPGIDTDFEKYKLPYTSYALSALSESLQSLQLYAWDVDKIDQWWNADYYGGYISKIGGTAWRCTYGKDNPGFPPYAYSTTSFKSGWAPAIPDYYGSNGMTAYTKVPSLVTYSLSTPLIISDVSGDSLVDDLGVEIVSQRMTVKGNNASLFGTVQDLYMYFNYDYAGYPQTNPPKCTAAFIRFPGNTTPSITYSAFNHVLGQYQGILGSKTSYLNVTTFPETFYQIPYYHSPGSFYTTNDAEGVPTFSYAGSVPPAYPSLTSSPYITAYQNIPGYDTFIAPIGMTSTKTGSTTAIIAYLTGMFSANNARESWSSSYALAVKDKYAAIHPENLGTGGFTDSYIPFNFYYLRGGTLPVNYRGPLTKTVWNSEYSFGQPVYVQTGAGAGRRTYFTPFSCWKSEYTGKKLVRSALSPGEAASTYINSFGGYEGASQQWRYYIRAAGQNLGNVLCSPYGIVENSDNSWPIFGDPLSKWVALSTGRTIVYSTPVFAYKDPATSFADPEWDMCGTWNITGAPGYTARPDVVFHTNWEICHHTSASMPILPACTQSYTHSDCSSSYFTDLFASYSVGSLTSSLTVKAYQDFNDYWCTSSSDITGRYRIPTSLVDKTPVEIFSYNAGQPMSVLADGSPFLQLTPYRSVTTPSVFFPTSGSLGGKTKEEYTRQLAVNAGQRSLTALPYLTTWIDPASHAPITGGDFFGYVAEPFTSSLWIRPNNAAGFVRFTTYPSTVNNAGNTFYKFIIPPTGIQSYESTYVSGFNYYGYVLGSIWKNEYSDTNSFNNFNYWSTNEDLLSPLQSITAHTRISASSYELFKQKWYAFAYTGYTAPDLIVDPRNAIRNHTYYNTATQTWNAHLAVTNYFPDPWRTNYFESYSSCADWEYFDLKMNSFNYSAHWASSCSIAACTSMLSWLLFTKCTEQNYIPPYPGYFDIPSINSKKTLTFNVPRIDRLQQEVDLEYSVFKWLSDPGYVVDGFNHVNFAADSQTDRVRLTGFIKRAPITASEGILLFDSPAASDAMSYFKSDIRPYRSDEFTFAYTHPSELVGPTSWPPTFKASAFTYRLPHYHKFKEASGDWVFPLIKADGIGASVSLQTTSMSVLRDTMSSFFKTNLKNLWGSEWSGGNTQHFVDGIVDENLIPHYDMKAWVRAPLRDGRVYSYAHFVHPTLYASSDNPEINQPYQVWRYPNHFAYHPCWYTENESEEQTHRSVYGDIFVGGACSDKRTPIDYVTVDFMTAHNGASVEGTYSIDGIWHGGYPAEYSRQIASTLLHQEHPTYTFDFVKERSFWGGWKVNAYSDLYYVKRAFFAGGWNWVSKNEHYNSANFTPHYYIPPLLAYSLDSDTNRQMVDAYNEALGDLDSWYNEYYPLGQNCIFDIANRSGCAPGGWNFADFTKMKQVYETYMAGKIPLGTLEIPKKFFTAWSPQPPGYRGPCNTFPAGSFCFKYSIYDSSNIKIIPYQDSDQSDCPGATY